MKIWIFLLSLLLFGCSGVRKVEIEIDKEGFNRAVTEMRQFLTENNDCLAGDESISVIRGNCINPNYDNPEDFSSENTYLNVEFQCTDPDNKNTTLYYTKHYLISEICIPK